MSEQNRGILIIMDSRGDTEVHWGIDNEAEVVAARSAFGDLRRKGYLAYRLRGGQPEEVLTEFDPEAEQIIMAPPMRGG
jgi:hypothetical protein